MTVGNFERDTTVSGTDGRYAVNLSEAWSVWGPNGGYVAAIALRALAAASSLPRPAVFHCQFLKAGRFDAAEVLVERVRSGKRTEALRARLVQDGEDLLNATLWMTADDLDGLEHDAAVMPDVKKPADLKSFAELFDNYADWYLYWRSVEARPAQDTAEPGPPIWRGWMRLGDSPKHYDMALAAARTVFWMDLGPWNAAIATHKRPLTHLGPNLDLHVQFHRFDEPTEWQLLDAEAPIARDGLIGSTLKLWDENGALVASGGSTLFCRRNPNYEDELRRMRAEQE